MQLPPAVTGCARIPSAKTRHYMQSVPTEVERFCEPCLSIHLAGLEEGGVDGEFFFKRDYR